jgi:Holliday junction resolvase RusA-like endonuclease
VVPDKRKHDLDNCMAMLKPCWDGLVDAGLLVDDDSKHLRLAAPEMRVVKGERFVEVTLT